MGNAPEPMNHEGLQECTDEWEACGGGEEGVCHEEWLACVQDLKIRRDYNGPTITEDERIDAIEACQTIYMECGIGIEQCNAERDKCFDKIPDVITKE